LTTPPTPNSILPVGRCAPTQKYTTFQHSKFQEATTLIKQDIVHHVIERTGLPRAKAEAAVDTVFEGLKDALAAGDRIELRGFGVFSVRPRKTGIGRNPRTGTEVSIAPGKAVRFKPGKELHALNTDSAKRG
jgi:nucleoid DNA-binding protein